MDDFMFNAALMDYMFSNAYKAESISSSMNSKEPVKDIINEEEAMKLSQELIELLEKHNLSYKDAYRVMLAMTCAMAIGGVEYFGPGFPDEH